MTPALETTRDLHDRLVRRLGELSHRAASLVEEAGTCIGDELGWLSADIAALTPIVEELQDRERFPAAVRTQTNPNAKGSDHHD